jgi:hypothetical protein
MAVRSAPCLASVKIVFAGLRVVQGQRAFDVSGQSFGEAARGDVRIAELMNASRS